MLYVFSGPNSIRVRMRAFAFLDTYDAHADILDASMCRPDILRDRIGAQSLFDTEHAPLLTVLDTPSDEKEALETVRAFAEDLVNSKNIFVLIEHTLLSADAKIFRTHATEYVELKEKEEGVRFNVFALSEAFLRRDKKSLWMLYTEALRAGLSSEEIVGTLLWQLKVLRLASRTKGAHEAGLKDFVYTKAKRGLGKYKSEELDTYSRELIALYHDARLGKRDMDIALERFVLAL